MEHSNTRSGAESGTSEAIDDDENVELEKSNVLLMGPTGSGINSTLCLHIFSLRMAWSVNQHLSHC